MSGWILLVFVSVPLLVGELAALAEVALARSDLSPLRRLAWFAFLVVVPYVSLAAYLVVRPSRAEPLARPTTGGDRRAAELVRAAERHAAGELSDEDYDRAVSAASVSGWSEAVTGPSAADR